MYSWGAGYRPSPVLSIRPRPSASLEVLNPVGKDVPVSENSNFQTRGGRERKGAPATGE
jgi:hypothetical protein